jgi:hypothetical protein
MYRRQVTSYEYIYKGEKKALLEIFFAFLGYFRDFLTQHISSAN